MVKEVGFTDGVTTLEALSQVVSKNTGAVIIQNPNFFGNLEDLSALIAKTHGYG